MRKLSLLLLSTLALAAPLYAARGKDQSYITYDDGGTVIRQAEDGKEVDARVNMPIYPGDEVITSRRGRTEIRLADGNVIALDRSTEVRFRSILDSYETDAAQTVVELHYGHVAVQRTDVDSESMRLDTESASYWVEQNAIYAVDTGSRSADRITVFQGEVEVRTPSRTTRVAAGEEARVDNQGLYGLVNLPGGSADEFERWFMRRSQRYNSAESRYLDRSLSYADYDLGENGSWTFVAGLGTWGWRPYVGVNWRPYYYGHWGYGPTGALVWISTESWGWVPYHYGRWAYEPGYGWVWLPGYSYAPAWVYWMYGPGYVGWAPAGWFDCYRPYYGWAYRPYARAGFGFGPGYYGHVRLHDIDLRPWTFVSPNSIVSTRIDQAAINADAIRQRLLRDPSAGHATIGVGPARFTRSELRDPAAAVNAIVRRGSGSGTGREGSGSVTDLTPFFRRDPELSTAVRERVVRGVTGGVVTGITTAPVTMPRFTPSGVPSPGTPGTLEGRIGPRTDRSEPDPRTDTNRGGSIGSVVGREGFHRDTAGSASGGTVGSGIDRATKDRAGTDWRGRIDRPSTTTPAERPSVERGTGDRTPATPERSNGEGWRGRAVGRGEGTPGPAREAAPADRKPVDRSFVERSRGSDIGRRIIDRIGGARIYGDGSKEPRDSGSSSPPPAPRERERASSPPPPREEHSSPPPQRNEGGGHHDSGGGKSNEGGHVKRQ